MVRCSEAHVQAGKRLQSATQRARGGAGPAWRRLGHCGIASVPQVLKQQRCDHMLRHCLQQCCKGCTGICHRRRCWQRGCWFRCGWWQRRGWWHRRRLGYRVCCALVEVRSRATKGQGFGIHVECGTSIWRARLLCQQLGRKLLHEIFVVIIRFTVRALAPRRVLQVILRLSIGQRSGVALSGLRVAHVVW